MVLLDLSLAANQGLSSRQNSTLSGGGDSLLREITEDDDKIKKLIKKVSHLYLQGKNITKISPAINKLRNLSTIYLYDNKISNVSALAYAKNLQHVYLQGNDIENTFGLSKLTKLEKLYLSNNRIEVVEDLVDPAGYGSLKELYLDNQKLGQGHQLIFDPETLNLLGQTLQILNISANQITNIDQVLHSCHQTLIKLDASNNNIAGLANSFIDPITNQPLDFSLTQLVLKNNPFQSKQSMKYYRQQICCHFQKIKSLDGKEISNFEKKWHLAFANRTEQKHSKKQPSISKQYTYIDPTPIPSHWRSRGLPGGRDRFDLVLAKAANSRQTITHNHEGPLRQPSPQKKLDKGDFDEISGKGYPKISEGHPLESEFDVRPKMNLTAMKLAPID